MDLPIFDVTFTVPEGHMKSSTMKVPLVSQIIAELPQRHWLPWVKKVSDLNYGIAKRCMTMTNAKSSASWH
jgi:hypothetical protein